MHKIHYITLKWKEIKGISSHQVGYLAPGWKTSSTSKLTNWRRMEESLLWKPPWIPKGHLEIKFHLLLIFNPHPFKIHLLLHIYSTKNKLVENHRKSLIQHCKRSELYVYFLNGQKFIKRAKNGRFWRVFENLEYQTGGKCQNSNETFCVIFNNV